MLPLEKAWAAIHLPTLALLLGLMLLASELAPAGFFAVIADDLVNRFRSAHALLGAVVVASGVLSAVFLNDAICILFTPLILRVAKRAGRDPLPLLLGVATASNVGGACSITGNPHTSVGEDLKREVDSPARAAVPRKQKAVALADQRPVPVHGIGDEGTIELRLGARRTWRELDARRTGADGDDLRGGCSA